MIEQKKKRAKCTLFWHNEADSKHFILIPPLYSYFMKFSHSCNQTNLFHFGNIGYEFPVDHELVKLEKEIPWNELVEIIAKKYSSKKGRNSKSLRMMMGLEIVKRKYGYSDEELMEKLQTDLAIMYFCGFDHLVNEKMDSSNMTKFRNRLDVETLALLEEVSIRKFIRKAPNRKIHQVITDSTCIEANITYPTDTKLLTKVFQKLSKVIEKGREIGVKTIIRGKRKVKKLVRAFNLKRKKSKKEFLKMRNFLIREGQKVFKKAQKVLEKMQELKEMGTEKYQAIVETSRNILEQQKDLAKNKLIRIKGRIVSFHAPKIRPIFRGKEGKQTEFGQKIGVSVVGGGLMVSTKLAHENFSDTILTDAAIQKHERIFNRKPSELIGDRGLHSPANHEKLEKEKIRDGIQWRGKIPKKATLPPERAKKRMYRQRSSVEGKIGTVKMKYGLSKNHYKDGNCKVLITFGLLAMNGDWVARQS